MKEKIKKYNFTPLDKKLRRYLEKRDGQKMSDQEFYKYLKKYHKWLDEFVRVMKKWIIEKPLEAEQLSRLMKSLEEKIEDSQSCSKIKWVGKIDLKKEGN